MRGIGLTPRTAAKVRELVDRRTPAPRQDVEGARPSSNQVDFVLITADNADGTYRATLERYDAEAGQWQELGTVVVLTPRGSLLVGRSYRAIRYGVDVYATTPDGNETAVVTLAPTPTLNAGDFPITIVRVIADSPVAHISGIGGGAEGRQILLVNDSTSTGHVVIDHESTASPAIDRIHLAGNLFGLVNEWPLTPGGHLLLWYDTDQDRWLAQTTTPTFPTITTPGPPLATPIAPGVAFLNLASQTLFVSAGSAWLEFCPCDEYPYPAGVAGLAAILEGNPADLYPQSFGFAYPSSPAVDDVTGFVAGRLTVDLDGNLFGETPQSVGFVYSAPPPLLHVSGFASAPLALRLTTEAFGIFVGAPAYFGFSAPDMPLMLEGNSPAEFAESVGFTFQVAPGADEVSAFGIGLMLVDVSGDAAGSLSLTSEADAALAALLDGNALGRMPQSIAFYTPLGPDPAEPMSFAAAPLSLSLRGGGVGGGGATGTVSKCALPSVRLWATGGFLIPTWFNVGDRHWTSYYSSDPRIAAWANTGHHGASMPLIYQNTGFGHGYSEPAYDALLRQLLSWPHDMFSMWLGGQGTTSNTTIPSHHVPPPYTHQEYMLFQTAYTRDTLPAGYHDNDFVYMHFRASGGGVVQLVHNSENLIDTSEGPVANDEWQVIRLRIRSPGTNPHNILGTIHAICINQNVADNYGTSPWSPFDEFGVIAFRAFFSCSPHLAFGYGEGTLGLALTGQGEGTAEEPTNYGEATIGIELTGDGEGTLGLNAEGEATIAVELTGEGTGELRLIGDSEATIAVELTAEGAGTAEEPDTGPEPFPEADACWNMNEASGTREDSIGSNDLLEVAGTVPSAAGKVGDAAEFASDGNYLYCPSNATLQANGDWTLSLWLYYTSGAGIVGKWDSGQEEFQLVVDNSVTGKLRLYTAESDFTHFVQTDDALATDTWHHIVVWQDTTAGVIGMRFNGGIPTTTTIETAITAGTAPFTVGHSGGGAGITGLIDAVQWFKQVLTFEQQEQLWNLGAGVGCGDTGETIPLLNAYGAVEDITDEVLVELDAYGAVEDITDEVLVELDAYGAAEDAWDGAYRVNLSSPDYISSEGKLFTQGTNLTEPWWTISGYSGGGNYGSVPDISGTTDDPLYQAYPYGGNWRITLNVPNGNYSLKLYFADTGISSGTAENVFDIEIDESVEVNDLDVYAEVGTMAAHVETIAVTVSGGTMNIDLVASAGVAWCNALELIPV